MTVLHDDVSCPKKKKTSTSDRGFVLYLIYALVIATLLSLYFIVKHRAFAFVDIGIDLFSFYYPIQVAQAHQLRDLHSLTWSFNLGLGGYLGLPINPLRLLCAPLPDSWQLGARLPIYFVRIILSGSFFYGYLRRIRFDPKLSVIGALAFSYSSYAVINGQWDSEGLVVLQFAAYLYFFESYLNNRKFWFAVGAGVTVGAGSVFYPFTFAVLTILYVIARPVFIAHHYDTSSYLLALIKYGIWAALGFFLTAFSQIPNLHYFLDSPRVTGDHAVFTTLLSKALTLNDGKTINAEIAGIFGKDLLGIGSAYHGYSNYFEAPGFYVGMLLLLGVSQLFGPSAKPREKLLGISGIVLFAAYVLWPAMRYAVYGFGHAGFRLSTLWVSAGLLVIGLAGLRRALASGTWRAGLVTAAICILIALLAIAYNVPASVRIQRIAMVIAFTATYCVVMWSFPKGSRTLVNILIPVFACELLLFAMPAFMHRNAVKTDGTSSVGSYHDGTTAALALAQKKDGASDFYRVEKTYRSVYLNDALMQRYSGTKSDYFHGKSITRFVDKLKLPRPHPRTAYIGSMVHRPDVLDLLGVRYVLSKDRKLDKKPHMVYLGSTHDINIYENTAAHTIGYLYQNVSGEPAADSLSTRKRSAYLLDHVLVDDPAAVRSRLRSMDQMQDPVSRPGADQVSLRKISDTHLDADVFARQASVMLVSMPFDIGWEATVDHVKTPLFRADYGLTALLMPAGRHHVSFRYTVVGRKAGKWISLTALFILIGYAITERVLRRRHRSH